MIKLKSFNIFLIICLIGCIFSSCSDEMINETPVNFVPANIIYGDSAKIVQYVTNIYSFLPTGYNRFDNNTSMLAASTDEAVHAISDSEMAKWANGSWDANSTHDNSFANCYTGIRRSFLFEEEILPYIDNTVMSKAGQDLYLGQVLFLRAYFNFELLKRFGGYPIVRKALSANENLDIPRNTYDECVTYITELCDQATELLPVSYATNQLGRATHGAALALKARTLLYSASPLFNDESKPQDDIEHGKYDATKWEKAAVAAAAVINLKNSNGSSVYSLYKTGGGYSDFFYVLNSNNEIILSRMAAASNTVERLNGPVSITNGQGGTCPTWDLVSAYEMINGEAFDWNNSEHASNPFANRDPRFGKSILHNGSIWMNNMTVETFEGGKDLVGNRATRTGFYLRKFCNINATWNAPTGTTQHCFPLLRYGELLLSYAEAMNEAYGPDIDPKGYGMTARYAVSLIRERAGLTGNVDLSVTVSNGDKEKMREAIRHERRIELAFEEHRHLDVRRWKIAESVLNKAVSGLKIEKMEDGTFSYTLQIVESRVFMPRMYLYPFTLTELSRNINLVQNTGW